MARIENPNGNPFSVDSASMQNTGYITADGVAEIFYPNAQYLEMVLADLESVTGSDTTLLEDRNTQGTTDPYENLQ